MDRRLFILGGVFSAVAFGCSDDANDPTAQVRVIHLAPNAGAVDVAVDGAAAPAVSALAYAKATDYLTLGAGSHAFAVKAAGTNTVALNVPSLALAPDGTYSVVAWGTSSVKGVVIDDSIDGLAAGSLRVNVVHAAEGVGQVDVWNIPSSGSPMPLVTDFDEGEQASLDLPSAAYVVGIDVDDDATPDLVFDIPALPGGQVVDLFAVADGTGPHLVAVLAGATVVTLSPRP